MSMYDFFEFYLSDQKLSESVSNQQSKFLTGPVEINKYNNNIKNLKNMVESNWFIESNVKSVSDVISSIYLNNIEVFDYSNKKLYLEISKVIGINYNKDMFENKLNISPFMVKDIYLEYYDKVANLNYLDLELYEHFKS
jgi:hypothetical protein